MYDEGGFHNIVNIDFSKNVIKKMTKRSAKTRPEMKYEVGDVFKLKYEQDSFEYVLDKGTLDAVFPENTLENS